jgi:foldase protein PrsA
LAIRDNLAMKPFRALIVLLVALALVVSGCGGGSAEVPSGAIAVVNGTDISRTEFDGWIAQAKKSYQATKRDFPKAGTPEYQQIQTYWVAFLVQAQEFEQAASDLGIEVSEKDVDKGVQDSIKQKFEGSRKKFENALKAQAFSESMYRKTIRVGVLGQKIYEKVTKDVDVSTKDAQQYYNQNLSTYQSPAKREVRHILIAKKDAKGAVDYPKSKKEADRIYAQLKAGGDFATLAKKYSADTQTAAVGGKYTALRGQTVPEFDKAVFELKTGEISKPVKTTYGYHVIQAISKITPQKTTPFSKVKNSIRTTLLQQKKQQVMYDWFQKLQKKYKSKISYAAGFAPPDIPDATSTDTTTQ